MHLDWIMGAGRKMACCRCWRMLIGCASAAGRSICCISSGERASAKIAARRERAYGRACGMVPMFKTPIGNSHASRKALARIGGNPYMIDAAVSMTFLARVDLGEKPSSDLGRSSSISPYRARRASCNDLWTSKKKKKKKIKKKNKTISVNSSSSVLNNFFCSSTLHLCRSAIARF